MFDSRSAMTCCERKRCYNDFIISTTPEQITQISYIQHFNVNTNQMDMNVSSSLLFQRKKKRKTTHHYTCLQRI